MTSSSEGLSSPSDFKIGEWWVRPQRHLIEQAGETHTVELRSMEVLVCLARRAPGVVSKQTLLDEVWADSPFVGDDVISHAIWELRKTLGDAAKNPTYIRTVPRRGYQLVAEVLRPQGSPLPLEGVVIDHYEIGPEIGRGAMGVVFEAKDRRLSRPVAIKFLADELTRDPKACRRFEREARLAASLDHPNLATVHQIGETARGHRYLVTPLYRGGSLKDRLADGPMGLAESVSLVRQLLAGLGAAHEREIVHRDIKPANLMLDGHGTLKICDFGIAKLLGGTDLTQTGATPGTPAYKSPEQSQGSTVDHRTDLWSAGVVLFELLTGTRPIGGDYEPALLHQALAGALEGTGSRVSGLEAFMDRALAKDPADRFQNAADMASALGELERAETRGPVVAKTGKQSDTWRLVVVLILVALVAALAVVALKPTQRPSFRPDDGSPPHSTRSTDESPAASAVQSPSDTERRLDQARRVWLSGNDSANVGQVRKLLEAAADLAPRSAEVKGSLAVFWAERYATDKAPEAREKALAYAAEAEIIDPSSPLPWIAQAWVQVMSQQVEEGKLLAEKALETWPSCSLAELCDYGYRVLAEAYLISDRPELTIETLERGLEEGGGHIRSRLKLAQVSRKVGDVLEAEKLYLNVLEVEPRQTTALHALGNFYLRQNRVDEAVPFLARHYDLTGDRKSLSSLGYAQYVSSLFSEAIETFENIHRLQLEAGEQNPSPLTGLGDSHLELGNKDSAQEAYRRALTIFDELQNPGISRQAQRAVCLAKLDRFDEADAEIQRILALPGRVEDTPELLLYAARIYALKGDREKLFEFAEDWISRGGKASRLLKDDPSFIPFREDREYLRILKPGLIPATE